MCRSGNRIESEELGLRSTKLLLACFPCSLALKHDRNDAIAASASELLFAGSSAREPETRTERRAGGREGGRWGGAAWDECGR